MADTLRLVIAQTRAKLDELEQALDSSPRLNNQRTYLLISSLCTFQSRLGTQIRRIKAQQANSQPPQQ